MEIQSLDAAAPHQIVQVAYVENDVRLRTTLNPGQDVSGWPKQVRDFCKEVWTDDVVLSFRNETAAYGPPPPGRDDLQSDALAFLDQKHASFMRELTGNATIEERDTWKTKEEAARAYLGDNASDGQKSMIELEAAGTGADPAELAGRIVAKAEAFQTLIGMAAGLRSKARAAIAQATADGVPLEQVGAALDQVFAQIDGEVQGAIAQWQSGAA